MPAEVTDVSSSDRDQISERCGWRARLGRFFGRANSAFSYLIGLPIITLLGGLLVGYYQYLNAYQEKIRARGENDATMATAVFTDISRKFSQAQMLQQALLLNVSNALDESASIDERVIAAKYAKSVSDTYEKSWVALLESGDLMARSAEIHIDWATDFKRGPGVSHYPNSDPLSRSLLAAYDFDCNDNLPKFVPTKSNRKRKTETCHVDDDQNPAPFEDSYVNLCPRRHGEVDPGSSVSRSSGTAQSTRCSPCIIVSMCCINDWRKCTPGLCTMSRVRQPSWRFRSSAIKFRGRSTIRRRGSRPLWDWHRSRSKPSR